MLEILDTFGVALLIGQYPHGPLGGLAMTLILSASALLLAFPLAVLVGIGRTAAPSLLRHSSPTYSSIRRSPCPRQLGQLTPTFLDCEYRALIEETAFGARASPEQ